MATTDKKSLLSEDSSTSENQLITDARLNVQESRANALKNAHQALLNTFGSKIAGRINEPDLSVSEPEINELIRELENGPEDDAIIKECRQRLDEAKQASPTEKEKMYKDIHRKFWTYVQGLPHQKVLEVSVPSDTDKAVTGFLTNKNRSIEWISYEGSMIICSLVAVSDAKNSYISLTQLPEKDREIVGGLTQYRVTTGFFASLDEYKNFQCYGEEHGKTTVSFTLGNRVASIPPHEASKGGSDVKVERKGKDIVIGDRIKLERNKIQNLVQQPEPASNGNTRGGFQPRTKVSGRNAYEIRADVLEMALDWVKNQGDKKMDADDVLDIAESFYSFVEHK